MALITNDLFIVERGGVQYKMTADQIAEFVGAIQDVTAADIAARDAIGASVLNVGDRVFVVDASADASVDSGWAVYRVSSTGPYVFDKIQEQESLDISVSGSDLGYTAAPGQGTVTNTGGTNSILPLASAINAGLMPPAMFANNHGAASSGLTPATNPVVVNAGNQQVTFNVTQLATLP